MNAPEWRGALAAAALDSAGSGIRLRVALPEDLPAIEAFVQALSLTTRVRRFFTPRRNLPAFLARALVEGDARHRFIVAEAAHSSPAPVVGLGQYARLASRQACELALLVGDEWQGRGLGARLLRRLIDDAGAAGLQEMEAEVLPENRAMLALARRFGFVVASHPDDPRLLRVLRSLEPVRERAAALTCESAPPMRTALRRAAAACRARRCAAGGGLAPQSGRGGRGDSQGTRGTDARPEPRSEALLRRAVAAAVAKRAPAGRARDRRQAEPFLPRRQGRDS